MVFNWILSNDISEASSTLTGILNTNRVQRNTGRTCLNTYATNFCDCQYKLLQLPDFQYKLCLCYFFVLLFFIGLVAGVQWNHDKRDLIRRRIAEIMMSDLQPPLTTLHYRVIFTPVRSKDEKHLGNIHIFIIHSLQFWEFFYKASWKGCSEEINLKLRMRYGVPAFCC